jgi:site-specific DNA recombinase
MARCSRSIESGDCTNRRQCRLDLIEEAVLGGLRAELKNPAVIETARRGFAEEWARLSKERSRESAAAEHKLQDARREAARLVDAVAKGEMAGRMVSARLAELEAEIDRQEARLAGATEANVVTLHPLLSPSISTPSSISRKRFRQPMQRLRASSCASSSTASSSRHA